MTTFTSGTRALVTGASSGLGLALAQQLARAGSRVLATDIHAEAPAELLAAGDVTYLTLDVTNDAHWDRAYTWVVENFDGLDLLFNNAGVAAGGRIELSEIDQWQWIIDINLLGVVRGCKQFVPMLKEQGSGHIVNTASAAGLVHAPTMSEYNAVKAAVVALSETLRHELNPWDVKVSVICPTFFKTNLSDSMRGKDEAAQRTAAKLINNSDRTADGVAAEVLKQVRRNTYLILPDRDAVVAYNAKRLARPVYDRMMFRAAARMKSKAKG
ncbi:short-chain dehydrogenase [Aeromicrobium sp. Root495]|uniref:SDR family NAD(P)-dependent oxidoreductase n=1 Tax=Aeromicrobium sp. Root495 TaxID=1736550 RepID=UPI0006FBFDF4|nr:SDR family NAD(P)-dependent oxidoreductase [Aeromicrobium sp. Root495]KQY56006.1 short-chain dehydrogenase [Aeromicrobium sp. Root495]